MSDWRIINADVLDGLRQLADESIQCVVTSPPYWSLRDYGVAAQLGLEARPDCLGWATGQPCGECYICHMVAVFHEVRRVLRDDGVCWVNMGDSYASVKSRYSQHGHSIDKMRTNAAEMRGNKPDLRLIGGYKDKDLLMIPARLALALQSSGWYLRSDIIWAKKNGMPESVTDRPTKSHEHIFLLAKSERYFYDAEAVKQPVAESTVGRGPVDFGGAKGRAYEPDETDPNFRNGKEQWGRTFDYKESCATGANLRDVWHIGTGSFSGAHFATFPSEIPKRCVKAGTSERGECPQCGKAWRRQVDKKSNYEKHEVAHAPRSEGSKVDSSGRRPPSVSDMGFAPQCDCGLDPIPQTVLDPFAGAGTTLLVAASLGRSSIGIELNAEYVALTEARIVAGLGMTATEASDGRGGHTAQLRMFE